MVKNRPAKWVRGLWKMFNGRKTEVEFSEELTHAYFGDHHAWSVYDQETSQPRPRSQQEE